MTNYEDFVEALVAQLPGLRRYAMAIAGNTALADDLVQDTIEKALRQSVQLRELPLLPRWLRRILHNLYVDEIRRQRSKGLQQDIMEFADHPELSIPAIDGGAARDFIKAMSALNFEHRQILLLVGLEGLSYREIAEELNVPIGTVMSRLARARERLRSLMDRGADVVALPVAKDVS
jgi:RNA polymerase sigma-70 factor (ECF subfamily)